MRKAPHVLKKTAAQTELTVKKKKKKKLVCCLPSGWELCFPTPEWLLAFSPTPTVYPWSGSERPPDRTASQRLWAGLYVSSTTSRRSGIDLPLWCLPNARPALVVMATRAMLVQVSYCDWDTCDSNDGGNERISSYPAAPAGGLRSPWCSEQWLEDWEGWGSTGSQVRSSAGRPPPPPSPRGFPWLEA